GRSGGRDGQDGGPPAAPWRAGPAATVPWVPSATAAAPWAASATAAAPWAAGAQTAPQARRDTGLADAASEPRSRRSHDAGRLRRRRAPSRRSIAGNQAVSVGGRGAVSDGHTGGGRNPRRRGGPG